MTDSEAISKPKLSIHKPYFFISLATFIGSFFLGWFWTAQEGFVIPGWLITFVVLSNQARHFGFLANILFIAAIVVYFKKSNFYYFPIAVLISGASFIIFDDIQNCVNGCNGDWVQILYFGWGYMLWLWSFVFLSVSHLNKAGKLTKPWHVYGLTLGLCVVTALPSIFSVVSMR